MSKKPAETELPAINSKDEDFLNKLVSYIGEKCSGECSVESLAEHLNVSRTVFYNKIKGLTGLSPIEFQGKIKLKMASRLIENGFNVSEAAFRTGFTDVKYFSRLFKHHFGHPPSHHKSETQVTSDQ
jgi:AraC-like DNA-binding protein